MKLKSLFVFVAVIISSLASLLGAFSQPVFADGETYEYISDNQILVSGGDIVEPIRLNGTQGIYGDLVLTTAVINGESTTCEIALRLEVDASSPGSGQVTFSEIGDGAIGQDRVPCRETTSGGIDNFTNGAVAIDTSNIGGEGEETAEERVIQVTSYPSDRDNIPSTDTVRITDSTGTVIATDTVELASTDGVRSSDRRYISRFENIDAGTYIICSEAADACITETKVRGQVLTASIGQTIRTDTEGTVEAGVRITIGNPPDGYVNAPIDVEIRQNGEVVASGQATQDEPHECPEEFGACTVASYQQSFVLETIFTGIAPGTYELCIVATDECEAFTKTQDRVARVVITAANSAAITSGFGSEEPEETCESTVVSLGWILCPVAYFVLNTLDTIVADGIVTTILDFNALASESNQREALRSVWGGFRTIANIGFVIAFLVVVYSGVTGGLMSAYDLKKLVPKLFIGAILVQLSFFITTELVNIFNAMGNSITAILLAPTGVDTNQGAVNALFSENNVDYGILGGALQGAVSALILLLIIIGAITSIIGVLLMIAVFILRNIALVVLTVVSPLAFVAWILPNTNNIFDRWWKFYIQLLAVFPIAMAFLASGKLVSYIWTQGGPSNWTNQWIGMIALFLPYLVAPKLLQFAGSAITALSGAVQNAKNTAQKRTRQARQTSFGQRGEARAKSNIASRVNRRYGVGQKKENSFIGKRVVQSGTVQRATARAQQQKRNIDLEDTRAARVNIDANRSEARIGFTGVLRDREGFRLNTSGQRYDRPDGGTNGQLAYVQQPYSGDEAEIEYLNQVLESDTASDEQQAAAVSTLLNVHSNNGAAVDGVNRYMMALDTKSETNSRAGDLRSRIIDENEGMLYSVPQLAYPKVPSALTQLDASQIHSLKTGSVESFMTSEDRSASDYLIDRTIKAVNDGGTEAQMVRDGSVALMYNNATDDQKKRLDAQFDMVPVTKLDDNGNQFTVMNPDGSPQKRVNQRYGRGNYDEKVRDGEVDPLFNRDVSTQTSGAPQSGGDTAPAAETEIPQVDESGPTTGGESTSGDNDDTRPDNGDNV